MNLTGELPEVSRDYARNLLLKYWDMRADVDFLTSERDQNIVVKYDDSSRFLLKISHPEEEHTISNLQTSALLHISQNDPSLPVPQLIPTLTGQYEPVITLPDGRKSMIRLFSFLHGTQLGLADLTEEIAANLGSMAARLDIALANLRHSHGQHELLWNTSRLDHLLTRLDYIKDRKKRNITEKYIDLVCDLALSRLAELPTQLIHNDLNLGNIFFEDNQVTGIIDFGDMLLTQRVIDPANLCAYLALDSSDPFTMSRIAAQKYITKNPLTKEEKELLPFLVVGRNLVTILITNWRASLMPEQAERILRHEHMAYKVLQRIASTETTLSNLFWGK